MWPSRLHGAPPGLRRRRPGTRARAVRPSLLRQARELAAYALVDRGVWLAQGGAPLALLVHGDSGLRVPVHVMRGFRANHPAARLYARWITGPKGRAIVAAQRGYRVTTE